MVLCRVQKHVKRELNSTIEEIIYISEKKSESLTGALEPDLDMYYYNPTEDDVLGGTPENYNELTSSLNQSSLIDTIISSSDVNLNINHNKFENHIFLGINDIPHPHEEANLRSIV